MLQKYLLSIGKPELFNLKNKIVFIYNASMLRYDDQTKIENLFGNYGSHSIMVSDVDNMIGGWEYRVYSQLIYSLFFIKN